MVRLMADGSRTRPVRSARLMSGPEGAALRRSRPSRPVLAGIAALIAVSVIACDAGTRSSPGATSIALPSVSLNPATETSTPEPAGTPGDAPPVGPPSNVPSPPGLTVDYSGPPDDLPAFVAAYRSAFQVPELTEEQIAGAGARLCTYLQRHATANGSVDLARALIEAEINEPGYPREVWELAFELANASYCTEFSVPTEGQG